MHTQLKTGSRLATLCAVLALLAGCASQPRVFTNQSPIADFSAYRTFRFAETLGTDGDKEVRSLMSQYLISEVSTQLERRGYVYAEDGADLTINFDLISQEKIRSYPSASYGGYYGYGYGPFPRYGYYGAYNDGYRITQITEGTLSVVMIDTATQGVVWEGIGIDRVTDEVRQNLEQSVGNAVALMFEQYPYVAGSSAPTADDTI